MCPRSEKVISGFWASAQRRPHFVGRQGTYVVQVLRVKEQGIRSVTETRRGKFRESSPSSTSRCHLVSISPASSRLPSRPYLPQFLPRPLPPFLPCLPFSPFPSRGSGLRDRLLPAALTGSSPRYSMTSGALLKVTPRRTGGVGGLIAGRPGLPSSPPRPSAGRSRSLSAVLRASAAPICLPWPSP